MSLPVLITSQTEKDLWRNAQWWADNRSLNQAERWYDGIRRAIFGIGDHPRRYPLARESEKFPFELRVMYYGASSHPTHRAIYIVRPDSIVVVSVRHTSQADLEPDDLVSAAE